MASSPSARSTTWSCRTSALRRELWKGNSGHGASQVCHSPDSLPPCSAISAGVGKWRCMASCAAREFGRWDHFWHDAPAVGVPTLLQLGCQRRHDGRLTPGAANMVVPRAFARRGPFEIPDRVGHFSSIGVSSFLPFQTLASPRRTPTASRARASPNHSPFSQRRFPLRSRAGTSAGRHPPDRARRLPSGSRSWSVPCNRARVAPGRWSSSRHASWPHRCTMSSET